jgi:hypothetical protein
MKTSEIGVPLVLTSASDTWNDAEFHAEWEEMVRTWMPTQEQLATLDDFTVECWALLRNLDPREELFLLEAKRRNLFGFEHGVRQGWWRSWTEKGPFQPKKARADDFSNRTMAHVMAELDLFPSVGQARKSGWDVPISLGLHRVGKNWVEIV